MVVDILGFGRYQVVNAMELAAHSSFLALLDERQLGVDTLLAFVIIVLNVFLAAVQQVETSRNDNGDDAYGAV